MIASTVVFIASIFFLLLLSAFFSASETGLTALSRAKLHKLKMEGNKRAILVSELRQNKGSLIGAILLGNNAMNIGASAIATSLAIHQFGEEGVIYATGIMTLLVLIFGEVLPKTYAFRHAERVALLVAPPLKIIVRLFGPVTATVQKCVDFLLRLFGLLEAGEEDIPSSDALRGAIDLHHQEGGVGKSKRDMLGSILDLGETEVSEVMIHRRNMETLNFDEKPETIVTLVAKSAHTRFPVWKDDPANIVGILHAKNLFRTLRRHKGDINALDIKAILSAPWYIPATTTLLDQLQAFQERHGHFALVVDEYGELLGLMTLEDILEEIVGPIEDEYDREPAGIEKAPEGGYIIDGTVTIRDLKRALDWNLPDEQASTVAGLVIHEAQRIPKAGQVFHFHGMRFTILERERNQITRLKLEKFEG